MNDLQTTVCVVGSGPAGAVLAYLLARNGVKVLLLEAQKDFERDFRGDTLHPSIMENMDELGLAEKILDLPHTKAKPLSLKRGGKVFQVLSFDGLPSPFPYITLMPQSRFLEFLTQEASRFPEFKLMLETQVVNLLKEQGKVIGVETKKGKKIFCKLVVACDGRSSTVRKCTDLSLKTTAPPMDVLWFKMPKKETDSNIEGAIGHISPGNLLAQLDRGDYWQFGGIVPKGDIKKLHQHGLPTFTKKLSKLIPEFTERLQQVKDWKEIGYFNVLFGRVKKWYQPGLLLIGDAAHVMSPVGGVGINYAVQDAVATANILTKPLLTNTLTTSHLKAVQKKRIWPTRVIQWFQGLAHKLFIKQALQPDKPLKAPWIAKIPGIRKIISRFIAFGLWKVPVDNHLKKKHS